MSRFRVPFLATAVGVSAALVSPVTNATRGLRRAMGAMPGAIVGKYEGSPQYRAGTFQNRLPSYVVEVGSQGSMAIEFAKKGDIGRPGRPVPLATPELPAQPAQLAATWLGHATVLLEIAGNWVLLDPVWSERVSPSATVGPKRSHPVPMELDALPELAAVLISHDHYDHLDTATIDWLNEHQSVPFVVPLGIGQHLRRWDVPDDRIIELDWEQSHVLPSADGTDLTLTCTEARHFSGRGLTRNHTLWSSWVAAAGPAESRTRVFFGGDTGYTPAFKDIGADHGPFDLTVLPIGAYDARWADIHMNPPEAVQTHLDVRGGILLPIHWATFDLAFHSWAAPVEWLVEEAAAREVTVALPRPGERFDADHVPTAEWWRQAVKTVRAS